MSNVSLAGTPPAARPLRAARELELQTQFHSALSAGDGVAGAHCIHEWWMRNTFPSHIEAALTQLWQHAAKSIPEWLPMNYVSWLPLVYDVAARFRAAKRGRRNIYLVRLESGKTVRVKHSRAGEIAAGVGKNAAILLYHPEKPGVARFVGELRRVGVETLGFLLFAAPMCDGAEAIQRVCLRTLPAPVDRLLQALGIASVRRVGLSSLPQQGALPSEHVGHKRIRTHRSKHCQGVVV